MEVLKRHHVWKQGPAIAAVQRHSSDVQNLPLFFDTDLGWTIPLVDTEMGIRRLFGFVSTEWVVRAREEPAINRPKDNDSFFASRAALLSDGFSVGVGDRAAFYVGAFIDKGHLYTCDSTTGLIRDGTANSALV